MEKKSNEIVKRKKIFVDLISTFLSKVAIISLLTLVVFLLSFSGKFDIFFKHFPLSELIYFPFGMFIFVVFEYFFNRLRNSDLNKLLVLSENKRVTVKEIAISLTYLFNLKKKNRLTKILLVLCGITLALLNNYYSEWNLLKLSMICIATWGLIVLKETIVEFRIRKGWFGTNKYEAKVLINFLIKNSDDIDFTDGNGKLKRTLFPDTTSSQEGVKPTEDGVIV
ncbi:hypothetical protein [Acinetobacter nosocomialis]|uniref:hypothetical protein n=1 Tax=Acinetobacter nosocomialis TaxID=106654 RepID=UPI0024486D94|nr:hypothetical protein [Acinetobacter nosocomialis]MDH2593993.1 hypothetical protein [Acinetobacter nosocomialis]